METRSSRAGRHLAWGAVAIAPAAAFVWLRTHPASDPKTVAPEQHFYIVSIAALVCFALAVTGVRAALRTTQPRVYLVSLGFLFMAGLFAVHGLATPGFVLDAKYFLVTGFSARMGMFMGGLFLALSALPFSASLSERIASARLPLFFSVGLALVAFAMVGLLFPESVPPRIMKASWFLNGTLVAVSLCAGFAAVAFSRMYAKSGIAVEGALALGALMLLEAQLVMHFATLWNWSWWLYHLQLLAAFTAMLAYPFEAASARRARPPAPAPGVITSRAA